MTPNRYNEYMEMKYCRRCNSKLVNLHDHVYKCENAHTVYANSSPACALFLLNDTHEVLVAIRAHNPGKGRFDVPGGFCDDYETLEAALQRELIEEIGLTPDQYSTPTYITSALDKYDYGGEVINVLSGLFWARIKGTPTFTPQDDVASVQFISVNDLNAEEFYFNAVQVGFRQLQESLNRSL